MRDPPTFSCTNFGCTTSEEENNSRGRVRVILLAFLDPGDSGQSCNFIFEIRLVLCLHRNPLFSLYQVSADKPAHQYKHTCRHTHTPRHTQMKLKSFLVWPCVAWDPQLVQHRQRVLCKGQGGRGSREGWGKNGDGDGGILSASIRAANVASTVMSSCWWSNRMMNGRAPQWSFNWCNQRKVTVAIFLFFAEPNSLSPPAFVMRLSRVSAVSVVGLSGFLSWLVLKQGGRIT